jgi:transcriptional regulator with XRE-family HTH domain/quercetin dioxygenase-like cupin family protein
VSDGDADGLEAQSLPLASRDLSRIAAVLRSARRARGLTQREVAAQAGVSPGLIGQIETGRTRPSVGTLLEVASVLGLQLDGLFTPAIADAESDGSPAVDEMVDRLLAAGAPARNSAVHRRSRGPSPAAIEGRVARQGHREVIGLEGGVTWELLTPEVDHSITFMLVTYPAGSASSSSSQLIRHDDMEYFYMLRGTLHVTVGFEEAVVRRGDSMSFDSARPHRFINKGKDAAAGLWCVMKKASG